MSFELREPVAVIGVGGPGARLAREAGRRLGCDSISISHDGRDLKEGDVRIGTGSIVNPSSQTIRGFALESEEAIRGAVSGYGSVILVANLAGRAGAGIAPVVSAACKEAGVPLASFAIMPFGHETDRLFRSGVALKRIRADSGCTIIVDNDAMLKTNPDLTAKACYEAADSAVMCMASMLWSGPVPASTGLLTSGSGGIEESLRDSLKMLYHDAPPGAVTESVIHVLGSGVPVGMVKAVSDLARGTVGPSAQVSVSSSESAQDGVVMLSAVQGATKFDSYDPLGMIPEQDTLDWDTPDCSYDCGLELPQIE